MIKTQSVRREVWIELEDTAWFSIQEITKTGLVEDMILLQIYDRWSPIADAISTPWGTND